MRASLAFRIPFISNYDIIFQLNAAFVLHAQVKISIANSSNQKNSLSTDFQTSSLVLCTVYFLLYFIPCFQHSSAFVTFENCPQGHETLPSGEKYVKQDTPAYLCHCCEDGYENIY